MSVALLYRGPLETCNFTCWYCPFVGRHSNRAAAEERDRSALRRLVGWASAQTETEVSIFFTPAGEALIHGHYRDGIVALTHAPRVSKVVAQTNLSYDLRWLRECDVSRLALWCTFHPDHESGRRFAQRCRDLLALGVRFSVGAVGTHDALPEIERLRGLLPPEVYLWVNAFQRTPDYYGADEVRRLERVDPLFGLNRAPHTTLGRPCGCGTRVLAIDGRGDVRRCPFVPEVLGNLYARPLAHLATHTPCPNATCHCHIGYVHLTELGLHETFAGGVLERIPARWPPA